MKLPAELTRKAGPLPVWAWALVIVGGFLAYTHLRAGQGTTQATGVPVTAGVTGSSSGATGQADNSSGDLLASLLDNQNSSYEALLAALQYGGAAGSSSVGSVPATGGGTDTSSSTAPTVDSGTNNAPAPVTQANAYDPAQAAAAAALGVSAQPNMTLDQLNTQLVSQGRDPLSYPDVTRTPYPAMIGGPSQVAPPIPFGTYTPTLVQPAPVDTTSATVAPGGRATIVKPVAA